jgi:hypothetical protein
MAPNQALTDGLKAMRSSSVKSVSPSFPRE